MSNLLPEDYEPTDDELAMGAVWQIAKELNDRLRDAALRGITVEIKIGQTLDGAVAPQVYVDGVRKTKVTAIWFLKDGQPVKPELVQRGQS